MTTATELMSIACNANDAMDRAAELATNTDQDWDHEATIYTFDDESVLVVSGPQVNSFTSRAAADEALNA